MEELGHDQAREKLQTAKLLHARLAEPRPGQLLHEATHRKQKCLALWSVLWLQALGKVGEKRKWVESQQNLAAAFEANQLVGQPKQPQLQQPH